MIRSLPEGLGAEALWPNLFYWNELDKGGLFPPRLEQPELFTEELQKGLQVTAYFAEHLAVVASERR